VAGTTRGRANEITGFPVFVKNKDLRKKTLNRRHEEEMEQKIIIINIIDK